MGGTLGRRQQEPPAVSSSCTAAQAPLRQAQEVRGGMHGRRQQGAVIIMHCGSSLVRIRICRIHMFLGLLDPDPDPLVRGTDPYPSIINHNQK